MFKLGSRRPSHPQNGIHRRRTQRRSHFHAQPRRRWRRSTGSRVHESRGDRRRGFGAIGHLSHRQGGTRLRPLHAPPDPSVKSPESKDIVQSKYCWNTAPKYLWILQHLEHEFDSLKEEYKVLESSAPTESNPSFHRKHNMRKREVKQGIKRLEKLMNAVSSTLSALEQALVETPEIQGVTLVLGGSLVRPQQVYEMLFSHERVDFGSLRDRTKTKVAEALSRKAVRALISNGAGSCAYAGPTKLFLLVKCPCNFHLPLHFLPKRDFRYSKKIVPFKLHVKCKIPAQIMKDSRCNSDIAGSTLPLDSALSDTIWFQCRHVIKGLASKAQQEE